MAGYTGRKHGVNVSQYIADLNKEPSAFELERSAEDTFSLDDELAQFTNAEFLDFDSGSFLDSNAGQAIDFNDGQDSEVGKADNSKANGKPAGLDFSKGTLRSTLLISHCAASEYSNTLSPWNSSLVSMTPQSLTTS